MSPGTLMDLPQQVWELASILSTFACLIYFLAFPILFLKGKNVLNQCNVESLMESKDRGCAPGIKSSEHSLKSVLGHLHAPQGYAENGKMPFAPQESIWR